MHEVFYSNLERVIEIPLPPHVDHHTGNLSQSNRTRVRKDRYQTEKDNLTSSFSVSNEAGYKGNA